jgi:hypothetical protein
VSPFLSRQFRQWHWISSALVLALMLLFSVTGFTLNHPSWFEASPVSSARDMELSADLVEDLAKVETGSDLPSGLSARLSREAGVPIPGGSAALVEFEEMILDLGGPGVDATLSVDLVTGEAFYERIDNGLVAKLNDLHKGRDTGLAWGLMIDLTALACLVFCISGLGLLVINARARASTWPLTSLGLVIPLTAYILFVHT